MEDELAIGEDQSCLEKILKMAKEDNNKGRASRIQEKELNTLIGWLKEKLLNLSQEWVKTWTSDEILTVGTLILIVCEVSCNEFIQSPLLDDEDLYRNTIGALKMIHSRYKAKPLRDTDTNSDPGPEDEIALLKKDLVRLVANLTHNRPHFQLIASKIDAVPLILDLHSYDVNNPFIREWAAFATRNLLHNCPSNIEIARGIQNLNVVADPSLMEKLNLNLVDGKLVSKSADGPTKGTKTIPDATSDHQI